MVASLKCLRTKDLLSQSPACAASCVKRGVLACGQEAAGGYLDLGGLPPAFCWRGSPRRRPRSETAAERGAHTGKRTIAAAANNSLCLRPLVARHTLSLSDFQSEFLDFSFWRPQQKEAVGCYARGGSRCIFKIKFNYLNRGLDGWWVQEWPSRLCQRAHSRTANSSVSWPPRRREADSSAQTGAEGSPSLAVHSANPVFPPTHCTLALIGRAQNHLQRARWKFIAKLEGVVWSRAVSINSRWKDLRIRAVRLPRSVPAGSPLMFPHPPAISIKLSGSLQTTLHRYHLEFFFFFPIFFHCVDRFHFPRSFTRTVFFFYI